MSAKKVPLRSVCAQDRASVRPGERGDLTYLGLEGIEADTGQFVGGDLSKTPETPQANSFLFDSRHVLYGKLRPYLNKVAVPEAQGKCSTEIVPLLPGRELNRQYLAYYLRSPSTVAQITDRSAGARMPRADMDFVLSLEIPLLHLDEQRRIVDILSRAEGIVRLRGKAQRKAAELIPAIFIDMFGDPATNPKQWPVRRLGDVVRSVSGGTPAKARPEFWDGDLPWVSPKDMKRDEIVDAEDHVNRRVLSETSLKLVPPGSVLIVVRGMILVHTVPVAITQVPVTINQDMKALRPASDINATYLQWVLKVNHAKLLGAVSTAAHGTKKLDTDALMAMPVPIPPPLFQQQFGARILAVRLIVSQQVDAAEKAKAIFDAILSRAFGA